MLEHLEWLFRVLKSNFPDNIIEGLIMVSAIIVFIGVLKPLLFNKMSCKPLRKVLLGLMDLVFALGATAVSFVIKGVNFEHYLYASAAVFVMTIVVYWFYENTCFRNLIHTIGSVALKKCGTLIAKYFSASKEETAEIKTEIANINKELVSTAKKEMKKLQQDQELTNI